MGEDHRAVGLGGPLVLLVLLALGVFSCAACAPRVSAAASADPRTGEHEIHELVNQYRRSRRLPPLRYSRRVAAVARAYSRAMAHGRARFSHAGLAYRAARASRNRVVVGVGENLVTISPFAPQTATMALRNWLESPPHRDTLEGCYNLTGVGIAHDSHGSIYITQIFLLEARPGLDAGELVVPSCGARSAEHAGRSMPSAAAVSP